MTINGNVVCESKARYGGGSQVLKGEDGMSSYACIKFMLTHSIGKAWETLSSMGECNEPIKLKKGDQVVVEARYDFEAHPARKHAVEDGTSFRMRYRTFVQILILTGGMAEVMGLFSTNFAPDPDGTGGKFS